MTSFWGHQDNPFPPDEPRRPHCPVCGDDPTITELIDYEQAVCELKH